MSIRIIEFGRWNNNPIKWTVLWENSYSMLVLSESWMSTMQYSSNNNSDWGKSDIRKYLNGEFWKTAFSENEKKQIINTKLLDVGGVKDNIFLISMEEAKKYLTLSELESKQMGTRTAANGREIYYYYSNGWNYNYSHDTYHIYPAILIKK